MTKVRWDKSVLRMKKIAERDGRISHPDVINILRGTLDHGGINKLERNNLENQIYWSASDVRSKRLIRLICNAHSALASGTGKLKLHAIATNLVFDFLGRSGPGKFKHLNRNHVGVGILKRLANPGLINQGGASLCGPSALLFSLAKDNPTQYVKFAVDLFEKGSAQIGKLKVNPSSDCRNYMPPYGNIDQIDWMTAASLRDSENWFFDYDSVSDQLAGITMPGELAKWFRNAGFRDVKNVTNIYFNKGRGTLREVKRLHSRGYRICLFIGVNMLNSKKQTKGSTTAEHWVVLTDVISTTPNVKLKIFTWGEGRYMVPQGRPLSEKEFCENFYGYVAAKP